MLRTHVIALAAVLALGPARAQQYVASTGIDTPSECGKAVRLAAQWRPVFEDRFADGLASWKAANFEGALRLAVDTAPGDAAPSLSVSRAGQPTDVAWGLERAGIAVRPARAFVLRFETRHGMSLLAVRGGGESYWSRIVWSDANGRPVGEREINYGAGSSRWQAIEVRGATPARAVRATIQLGFDVPNLRPGDEFRLRNIVLSQPAEPRMYVPAGALTSRPVRVGSGIALVRWVADVPARTAATVRVRRAPDSRGAPGRWTAWQGPSDDSARSFASGRAFDPPAGEWLQYRIELRSNRARLTPCVRAVEIVGSGRRVADRAWDGRDTAPVAFIAKSPGRRSDPALPISFVLTDGPRGTGLDLSSVRVGLDGVDITGRLRRTGGGRFTYRPSAPLTPCGVRPDWGGWRIDDYEGALTIGRAEPRVAGGAPALRIERGGPITDTSVAVTSPRIAVKPGAEYTFAVWVRSSVSLAGAAGTDGKPASGIRWIGADRGSPDGFAPLDLGSADGAWRRLAVRATAPGGAQWAAVTIGFDLPDLYGGARVMLADPALAGPRPLRPGATNLHCLSVCARDLAGNAMARPWHVLVKPRPARGIVTVRDDGVTLVDGKPFFPIGIYAVWKRAHNGDSFDRAFAELRSAGFNCCHTYSTGRGPDFREFYASAARHGMRVIVAATPAANGRDAEAIVPDVANECGEPALFAWYLADDTSSAIAPAALRAVHEAVRTVDPFHITCQADVVGSAERPNYDRYASAADAFMPELYPIYSRTERGQVARLVRDMCTVQRTRAGLGRGKPLWAIVQDFFGWGWQRYPTDAEVRAMTYLSIIHGATGVTYYTYGGHGKDRGAEDDPAVWANLKSVVGELSSLHDVLCARAVPQAFRMAITGGARTDSLGRPSVSALLKVSGGKHYLFAANAAEEPATVSFRAAGLQAHVRVLFEDRAAAVRAGVLADTFAGCGAHVYTW